MRASTVVAIVRVRAAAVVSAAVNSQIPLVIATIVMAKSNMWIFGMSLCRNHHQWNNRKEDASD